jgi:N-acetylmuramoyl-L-alanine amidase
MGRIGRWAIVIVLVALVAGMVLPVMGQETGMVVNANMVNLRSGPGTNFSILTGFPRGTQVTVLARSADNAWVQVSVNNIIGWMNAQYVTTFAPPPVIPTLSSPFNGLINAVEANVRSCSSTFCSVIAQLRSGASVTVTARSADNAWVVISAPGGLQGWVNTALVNTTVGVPNLPISTATFGPPPTPTPAVVTNVPVGIVSATALNVRSGPGQFFSKIGRLVSGQSISLVGRNGDNSWLLAQLQDGSTGWVDGRYIVTSYPLGNLPVRG